MKCPKCGGGMEEGAVMAVAASGELIWVKKGKKVKLGAPKVSAKACVSCGYVENYVDRK